MLVVSSIATRVAEITIGFFNIDLTTVLPRESLIVVRQLKSLMSKTIRVGAVRAEPVWLDRQGSVDKTVSLIKKAGEDGITILGFPKVWIPGYPW